MKFITFVFNNTNKYISPIKLKKFVSSKLKKDDNICIIIGYQNDRSEKNRDKIESLWNITKDMYFIEYNNVFFVYFSNTKEFTYNIRDEIDKQLKLFL